MDIPNYDDLVNSLLEEREREIAEIYQSAEYSHSGLSKLIEQEVSKYFCWNSDSKETYYYDGTRWTIETSVSLLSYAQTLLDEKLNNALSYYHNLMLTADAEIIKQYEKKYKFLERTLHSVMEQSYAKRLEERLKLRIAKQRKSFDSNPLLLNLLNGTLNIDTRELKPHNPEDFITRKLNIKYDVNATCNKWNVFLNKIFLENKEHIRFIQQYGGLSLSDISLQKICYLYGKGANGKSVLVKTLQDLLGNYAVHISCSLILASYNDNDKKPVIAELHNKRMCSFTEIPKDKKVDDAIVKNLTSGDAQVGRHLYERQFEFEQTATFWITGNHLLRVTDDSDGFWRRMILVNMVYQIPENERIEPMQDVVNDFLTESSGLLNWLLDGYHDFLKNKLIIPESFKKDTEEYRGSEDSIKSFLDECTEEDKEEKILLSDLFKYYKQWSNENGNIDKYRTPQNFSTELKRKNLEVGKGAKNKVYVYDLSLI